MAVNSDLLTELSISHGMGALARARSADTPSKDK
jgi:hypothetical protein